MTTTTKRKPAKPKLPDPLEADVQKGCLNAMARGGWKMHRRNVLGVKVENRFLRNAEPGMSDTTGYIPRLGARAAEVEIKRKGKRPTLAQVSWLLRCHHDGCVAFWCDSVEQCEGIVEAINNGGWIEYIGTKRLYPVLDKKNKPMRGKDGKPVKYDGPSGDFMVIQQGGAKR